MLDIQWNSPSIHDNGFGNNEKQWSQIHKHGQGGSPKSFLHRPSLSHQVQKIISEWISAFSYYHTIFLSVDNTHGSTSVQQSHDRSVARVSDPNDGRWRKADTARFLRSGLYSDLTILCREASFAVHKVIICSQSEFFALACKGPWKVSLPFRFLNH